MNITLSEKEYANIKDVINDYNGIIVDNNFVDILFKRDSNLLDEFISWGAHDTCFREQLGNTISMELINKKWPNYGENKGNSFELFCNEINEAATKRGLKVI